MVEEAGTGRLRGLAAGWAAAPEVPVRLPPGTLGHAASGGAGPFEPLAGGGLCCGVSRELTCPLYPAPTGPPSSESQFPPLISPKIEVSP